MRVRRLMIIVGAALSVTAGPAGCATTGAPRPARSVAADPVTALTAAAGRLGTQSAHFTIAMGQTWDLPLVETGTVDAASGNFEIVADGYVWRRIGDDLYIKLTRPPGPGVSTADVGKWIREPLPPGSRYSFTLGGDFPWAPARRAAHGTGISRTGEHSFQGTLPTDPDAEDRGTDLGDMSRFVGSLRGTPPPTQAPGSASADDFLAELDAEGRFVRVRLGLGPDDPVLTYADFGTPAHITAPPPGELIEDTQFDPNTVDYF
jgi:hypothetical protein